MPAETAAASLRERKRVRTRAAIVDAALKLFAANGYDGTTVADIAAAADIAPRTFFSYFASKDDVLLPGADARVLAALDAIAERGPDDRPADVLLRALGSVIDGGHDFADEQGALRFRLVQTVPAIRGRALQFQLDAQREIAQHLQAAYADDLDAIAAGAIVGAFVGAVTGAVQAMVDTGIPDSHEARALTLRQATEIALRPWQRRLSTESE
ncbi:MULTISPECIES: TetR/AcrR family transcriptional regulator [unclassified Mycolicibacterium]|uniref:TetR/AcrR family transcriptional regulator n=1 Tax=unclassified Mycolicibacterium TaxID=2636767 RepID=UPI0012DEEC16|nr:MULTISPECIES: TetR/AcrR family transcriptional regulator [unclassified Mycolicibacterium]MUL83183.1 TetR family transcriptional regulator [Mycolicibacterium sp. CBMA 329]MUL89518.1 TetR family transcriptional regulator [Mycolicibacterium sp. CBMA 331]MUM02725.1 TetR family transcriptional regulator [Mycolicibacterium sp. CBMA 334]MUM27372.1 TetR family transcriptional regulator [Mycolicibacterium sp. CBMA 295]MUM39034.1 TetR family transcriptional regulator [Mycolicibacterium sp. CBMA 247]